MRAFLKELVNHPIKHNSNAIPWEPTGRNQGVRNLDETRDAVLIALLDKEADARRNGVRRISAEIYADLKKNTPSVKSTPAYDVMPSIRLSDPESLLPKFRSAPASAVAAPPANPAPAPTPAPAPAAPRAAEGKLGETPARSKAKRGKLADLLAKEKAIAEQ